MRSVRRGGSSAKVLGVGKEAAAAAWVWSVAAAAARWIWSVGAAAWIVGRSATKEVSQVAQDSVEEAAWSSVVASAGGWIVWGAGWWVVWRAAAAATIVVEAVGLWLNDGSLNGLLDLLCLLDNLLLQVTGDQAVLAAVVVGG